MWIPDQSRLRIDGDDYNFRRRDRGALLVDDAGRAFTLRDPTGRIVIPQEGRIVELVAAGRALLLPMPDQQPTLRDSAARLVEILQQVEASKPSTSTRTDRSEPLTGHEDEPAVIDRSHWLERADEIMNAAAALMLVDAAITMDVAYHLYRQQICALDLMAGGGVVFCADSRSFRRRVRLAEFVAEEALSGKLEQPRRGSDLAH
jgi:hypothetical protein